MKSTTKVSHIMSKNVITISSTDSLLDIEQIFRSYHLRHAPVCEDGEVIGMISIIDLRRRVSALDDENMSSRDATKLHASEIMAIDPVTVQSHQTVREIASIFSDNEFHAIPVLENDNLVGIISTTDIIRFLMDAIIELEQN